MPLRRLAEDGGLSGGAGAGLALAAVAFAGLVGAFVLHLRRGRRSRIAAAGEGKMECSKAFSQDPEKGEIPEFAPEPTSEKARTGFLGWLCPSSSRDSQGSHKPEVTNSSHKSNSNSNSNGNTAYASHKHNPSSPNGFSKVEFSPVAQKQLGALLRELLEQQVAASLRSGLGTRLDALERQVLEAVERRSDGPAPPPVPGPAPPAVPPPELPPRAGASVMREMRDTQVAGAQTAAPVMVNRGTAVQEDFKLQDAAAEKERRERELAEVTQPNDLAFGPTMRQQALPDPPEKHIIVREGEALKSSLAAVRQQLASRDRQTTELQRQLKECRQTLWAQTEDQKASEQRLHALLSDPSQCSRSQAEELKRLEAKVGELSSDLSDAKLTEIYWCTVAKRQRAYFLQSERMADSGHDCATMIKRHPAGEIFLAPPPIMGDAGDMGPVWDVGSSHANPYVCDSWPFEPNTLARRTPQEPSMAPLEEDQDQEDCATDDDDASYEDITEHGNEGASGLPPMRLPSLPLAQAHPDDDDDEDEDDPQSDELERLPPMPAQTETARSL